MMNWGRRQQEKRNKYEHLREANQWSSFIKKIIPDHSTSGNAVISCHNYNKSNPTLKKLYSGIIWIGYSSNNVPPGFVSYFGTTLKVNTDGVYTIYMSNTTNDKGVLYINGKEIGNTYGARTYYQVSEFKVKLNKGYYGITVSLKKGSCISCPIYFCGFHSSFALFVKDPGGNVILHTDTNWKASSSSIDYKNLSEIKEILKKVELRKIANKRITKENAIILQKRSMENKIALQKANLVRQEAFHKSELEKIVFHKSELKNIAVAKKGGLLSNNVSNLINTEHKVNYMNIQNSVVSNKSSTEHNIMDDIKKYWWVGLLAVGHIF